MVAFLDTSGIYALADLSDPNHADAVSCLAAAEADGETWLLHSYVIVESAALLHRRLGWEAAARLLSDVETFTVRWVDADLLRAATEQFNQRRGRVSLVDEVSFLVMRESGVQYALAYDADFTREGFLKYGSGRS